MRSNYHTIRIREQRGVLFIKMDRPEAKNSINDTLLAELLTVIKQAEERPDIIVVVLEGNEQFFCTGMDFNAVISEGLAGFLDNDPNQYYNLLKLITTGSKVIVAKIDGQVNAGGIGIVAASDVVIADQNAKFGLSEALFGLLPACVLPFLIRRVGFQKAQWMTLMTQGISANRAYEIGLVDELSQNTADTLRRSLLRLTRLEPATIQTLKDYVSKLWIINEETQHLAVNQLTELIRSDKVQNNIKNFVQNGTFPWSR